LADLNTYGSIASLVGLVVSGLAFVAAKNAKEAAREIQDSFLFDQRIPMHLKVLDNKVSNYNYLLVDIEANKKQIKTLLSQIKSELISLSDKIKNRKALRKLRSTIILTDKVINREIYLEANQTYLLNRVLHFFKSFFLVSHSDIWKNYNDLNEIYALISNLKLDKKYLIK